MLSVQVESGARSGAGIVQRDCFELSLDEGRRVDFARECRRAVNAFDGWYRSAGPNQRMAMSRDSNVSRNTLCQDVADTTFWEQRQNPD
jgi:hypothetical protein